MKKIILLLMLVVLVVGCTANVPVQPSMQQPVAEAVSGDAPPGPGTLSAGCDPLFAKCQG